MKFKKSLLYILLSITLIFSSFVFAACGGGGNEEQAKEAVMISTDGKYEFHANAKGRCSIWEVGGSEAVIDGSITVREENSAITIVFDDEILDVKEGATTISFTYSVNGSEVSFDMNRASLFKGMDVDGVVLNTSNGGMMGFLIWSNGTIQTKILKLQSTHNCSFTKEGGFKIEATEEQIEEFGTLEVQSYDEATGVYTIAYDLKVNLPPFAQNPGTMTINYADLLLAFPD